MATTLVEVLEPADELVLATLARHPLGLQVFERDLRELLRSFKMPSGIQDPYRCHKYYLSHSFGFAAVTQQVLIHRFSPPRPCAL